MSDGDTFYIGNLILNGAGDGQQTLALSILPLPRRLGAASRARMQIRRVEIMRNFVAQQVRSASSNAVERLATLEQDGNANQQQQQQQAQQRQRSQSEQRLQSNGRGLPWRGFRVESFSGAAEGGRKGATEQPQPLN
ncbi:unnamed protein product [Gongylonema pulchrum]|uniref:Uncharacterized protein n=1 Tax=Gongylonema pulchrum TaxID=637853 RepID=A0A183DE69_9BILA|nr:unnamed protein product [Gongylonema pulchrum]